MYKVKSCIIYFVTCILIELKIVNDFVIKNLNKTVLFFHGASDVYSEHQYYGCSLHRESGDKQDRCQ